MGRQVNFYMTREDEEEFVRFVRTTGHIELLPYTSATPVFRPIQSLPDILSDKFAGQCRIFNPDVSSNLVVKFIQTQNHYLIDFERSPVIEFSRSAIKEKTIYRGRIRAEFTYLDTDKMILVPKEAKFSDWYNAVAHRIRNRYKHLKRLIYAGPGAQKLIEERFTLK